MPNRATKSQLDKVTETLAGHQPPRADVELLDDGSLLVTVYGRRIEAERARVKPCRVLRFNRRGTLFREAVRNGDGWDEYTADACSLDGWAGMPRSDSAVARWMRQEVRHPG